MTPIKVTAYREIPDTDSDTCWEQLRLKGCEVDTAYTELSEFPDHVGVLYDLMQIAASVPGDVQASGDFLKYAVSDWLLKIADIARGYNHEKLGAIYLAVRPHLISVEPEYREMFLQNIALPIAERFGNVSVAVERGVGVCYGIAATKFSPSAREQIYGSGLHNGMRRILVAMPETKDPMRLLEQFASIVDDLPSAMRHTFLSWSGPRICQKLEKIPYASRNAIFDQICDLDAQVAAQRLLPPGGFTMWSGATILKDLRRRTDSNTFEQVAHQCVQRWEKRGGVRDPLIDEPLCISPRSSIDVTITQKLQAAITDCNGEVDIVVHPLIHDRVGDVEAIGGVHHGRSRAEYEEYAQRIKDHLKGSPDARRVQIILTDMRYLDSTQGWIRDLGSHNHHIIVPVVPWGADSYATPLSGDIRELRNKFRATTQRPGWKSSGKQMNEWHCLTDILAPLGMRSMVICGEDAISELENGSPIVDRNNDMQVIHGTLACARRRLLRSAPVNVLGTHCFPDSTAFEAKSDLQMREASPKIDPRVPEDLHHVVETLIPQNFAAQRILTHIAHEANKTQELRWNKYNKFVTSLKLLAESGYTASGHVIASAILFAADQPVSESLPLLNSIVEGLFEVHQYTSLFGSHPITMKAFSEAGNLRGIVRIVGAARGRAAEIENTPLRILKGHAHGTLARLLSSERMSQEQFQDALTFYEEALEGIQPCLESLTAAKKREVACSYVTYLEELQYLTGAGILRGRILMPQAGADFSPLMALAARQQYSQVLPSQFIWMDSDMSRLRVGLNLTDRVGILQGKTGQVTFLEIPVSHGIVELEPTAQNDTGLFPSRADSPSNFDSQQRTAFCGPEFVALTGDSGDFTPAEEYLNGASVNAIIIKSYPHPNETDAELYLRLNRLIKMTQAGTYVLVANSDVSVYRYFSQHPAFQEQSLPREQVQLLGDYPHEDVSLEIPYKTGVVQLGLGDISLPNPVEANPHLTFEPKGRFAIFRRKGLAEASKNILDQGHDTIIELRGTAAYEERIRRLQTLVAKDLKNWQDETLLKLRTIGRDRSFYVMEEALVALTLLDALNEQKGLEVVDRVRQEFIAQVKGTVDEDAIRMRGFERHPTLWKRLRNLESAVIAQPTLVDSEELQILRHIVSLQCYLEGHLISGTGVHLEKPTATPQLSYVPPNRVTQTAEDRAVLKARKHFQDLLRLCTKEEVDLQKYFDWKLIRSIEDLEPGGYWLSKGGRFYLVPTSHHESLEKLPPHLRDAFDRTNSRSAGALKTSDTLREAFIIESGWVRFRIHETKSTTGSLEYLIDGSYPPQLTLSQQSRIAQLRKMAQTWNFHEILADGSSRIKDDELTPFRNMVANVTATLAMEEAGRRARTEVMGNGDPTIRRMLRQLRTGD